MNTTDGTTPGQKAVYTCDAGYQLIGEWYQSCRLTGNWTGTTPTCQPIGKAAAWSCIEMHFLFLGVLL